MSIIATIQEKSFTRILHFTILELIIFSNVKTITTCHEKLSFQRVIKTFRKNKNAAE
jgi:hypothetical protein